MDHQNPEVKLNWSKVLKPINSHTIDNQTTLQFLLRIFTLSGMQFLAVVDGTVMALAITPIAKELHLSLVNRNWVISAYIVLFGGLMLLGGGLGDRFGRKKIFLIGVTVFSVMSLLCGLAFNAESLIIYRALQGVGAALATPTALALIATNFSPGKIRNRAFAIFGAMSGIGSITGLVLGGLLVNVSWRLIFWINVPIGVSVAMFGFFILTEVQVHKNKLDLIGALTVTVGSIAIILALENAASIGVLRFQTLLIGLLGIVCFAFFIFFEKRCTNPLIPLSIFDNKERYLSILCFLLAGGLLMTLAYFIADYLQNVLKYSTFYSGIAVIPFAFGLAIASSVSSTLIEKIAPRWIASIGGIIIALDCFYASLNASVGVNYFPKLAIDIFLVGFGCGLVFIPLSIVVVTGVSPAEAGALTAVTNATQDIGGIIGLMAITQIYNWFLLKKGKFSAKQLADKIELQDYLVQLSEGTKLAFLACALIGAVIAILVIFIKLSAADVIENKRVAKLAKEPSVSDLNG